MEEFPAIRPYLILNLGGFPQSVSSIITECGYSQELHGQILAEDTCEMCFVRLRAENDHTRRSEAPGQRRVGTCGQSCARAALRQWRFGCQSNVWGSVPYLQRACCCSALDLTRATGLSRPPLACGQNVPLPWPRAACPAAHGTAKGSFAVSACRAWGDCFRTAHFGYGLTASPS